MYRNYLAYLYEKKMLVIERKSWLWEKYLATDQDIWQGLNTWGTRNKPRSQWELSKIYREWNQPARKSEFDNNKTKL